MRSWPLLFRRQPSPQTVRIPASESDWATFTRDERAAAFEWVWEQFRSAEHAGSLTWTVYTDALEVSVSAFIEASVTGGVACGFAINHQPWGSYTKGYGQTWTSGSVFWLDTGLGGIDNKLWRGGSLVSWGFGSGGGGTYAYAESSTDFKWAWESVTYQVQTWGSVQPTAGSAWLFRNRYCGRSVSV